jgi:hypothetical protein
MDPNVPTAMPVEEWDVKLTAAMATIEQSYPVLWKNLDDFIRSTGVTAKGLFNTFINESYDHLSKKDQVILIVSLLAAGDSPELTAGIIHWVIRRLPE